MDGAWEEAVTNFFLNQVYTKTEARDQWLALGNTQSLLSTHPTLGAGIENLSPRATA